MHRFWKLLVDVPGMPGEPWVMAAYGTEWARSLGEKSLTGRLFGLRDGEEAETLWDFRQYWHPGPPQLMLYPFGGDGTVGVGVHERISADTSRTLHTVAISTCKMYCVVRYAWVCYCSACIELFRRLCLSV